MKNFIKKFYKNCGVETSCSRPIYVIENKAQLYLYIDYGIAKLSKYVKISMQTSLRLLSREDFLKTKKD